MPEDPIEGQVEFHKKTWFLSIKSATHGAQTLVDANNVQEAWEIVVKKIAEKKAANGGDWSVIAFNRV